MGIKKLPIYEDIVRIGRERKDAIFLDIGCCRGCLSPGYHLSTLTSSIVATDARIVSADGFPTRNIIASDLKKGCQAPFPVSVSVTDTYWKIRIPRPPPRFV